jgi:putative ABC transport system permease protein
MTALFLLAARSLANRAGSVLLTLLAIALSVALFLSVEKARSGARQGFENTLSGTDLIAGAPTGSINLLLFSVFRIGEPTAEISYAGYQRLASRPDILWAVPVSLGDSHRGYRVMGTTQTYFEHYKFNRGRMLQFSQGEKFSDLFDAVIGAEVARDLGYSLGSEIVLSHGLGKVDLSGGHATRPFRVAGILQPTGTPVDRTVHVSLEAITALHVGWETGAKNPLADTISTETIRTFDLTPKTVTAVYLGLKKRGTLRTTQRAINSGRTEPMLAIAPGQTLAELWRVTGAAERTLAAVSAFVVGVGLLSILVALLTSLNERRREMSILRAVGARPAHIFALLLFEAGVLGAIGAALGVLVSQLLVLWGGPLLEARYGLVLSDTGLSRTDGMTFLAVTLAALFLGALPALMAVRRSLADGLSIRT